MHNTERKKGKVYSLQFTNSSRYLHWNTLEPQYSTTGAAAGELVTSFELVLGSINCPMVNAIYF